MSVQTTALSNARAAALARYGILLVLIVMVVALSILSPLIRGEQYFLTGRNLIQVALQAAINAIIAVGMTYVITSGGIDLSVGANVALGGVVAALFMRDLTPPLTEALGGIGVGAADAPRVIAVMGFFVAVIVGMLCGALNGFLITRLDLPPFIATLGTMGMFRGLALIISDGRPVYGFGRDFLQIFARSIDLELPAVIASPLNLTAQGANLISIPTQVIFAGVVALIFGWVLNRTKFGKYTIAIGGNEETTRLAGIPVKRYKLGIYMLCGLLTGAAAALLLARLSSGDPTFGTSFELDAIAATVMGGTSLSGGEGSVGGTVIGALVISLVRNGLNLFNVPSYWQEFVIGAVIVLAVMLDRWRKRQTRRV
jgi:ribose/xylose/arabinose/galactoside ABC-type transport system permease subunit